MVAIQSPWQTGPAELIGHALDHLHLDSDSDKRIAFLLLDVGVETLFNVYLMLPDAVTGAQTNYGERRNA